jgi:hypothetical protein
LLIGVLYILLALYTTRPYSPKRIPEPHESRIEVSSSVNVGTTFTVSLSVYNTYKR